jgi:putative phosphoesterase
MRVAALNDVHGNLPALDAVLAEVDRLALDAIVCGGDVVAGPCPRECLDRLRAAGALFVRGNADTESPHAPEGTWEWIAAQLDGDALEFLAEQPIRRSVGAVLYCHGSPRDEDEILTRVSSDERFRDALAGITERVVVGGHTHIQFSRLVDGITFANAGSVGMPYEGRPGAFWSLVDGTSVEHRCTPYAVAEAVGLARATTFPFRDDFCDVLENPKDPGEISEFFEGVAATRAAGRA